MIFGDYPYHFNITLTPIDPNLKRYSVGEEWPENYGYIRRVVMIKEPADTKLNLSDPYYEGEDPTLMFIVNIPMSSIYANLKTQEYQIDPKNDGIEHYYNALLT